MFVFKEKYIPIMDNFVSIKLNDLYIYMDLNEFKRLYEAQEFVNLQDVDQVRILNTLKFEKELQDTPLNAIRYYAYLIENNLEEIETVEEYIDYVSWLFTKPIVCTSSLKDLIDSNMFYLIPDLQDVEYAREKFASNCIQNKNIQIQSVAKVTPTHYVEVINQDQSSEYMLNADKHAYLEEHLPKWQKMCNESGQYYTGYGVFRLPNNETFFFDADETKLIEEYLNWVDDDDFGNFDIDSKVDLSDITVADETSDGVYEVHDKVMPQHILDLTEIVAAYNNNEI